MKHGTINIKYIWTLCVTEWNLYCYMLYISCLICKIHNSFQEWNATCDKPPSNRYVNRFLQHFVFTFQERDFDKHVAYCRDEPIAQEFLQENESVRDYFEVSHCFQILNLVFMCTAFCWTPNSTRENNVYRKLLHCHV